MRHETQATLQLAALPQRRLLPRRRDRPAGPPRAGAEARGDRRAESSSSSGRRSRAFGRVLETAERRRPRTRGRARPERVGHGLAARRPPDELRQRGRPHRACARAARRDRLDRRRGDHRRPHVPPLLPDDAGWACADGQRLGPARARRPRRRRRSSTTCPRKPAPSAACATSSPPSPPRRSRRGGAARSTSRPTSCRASARCREHGSTTAPATPATASGRAGSAGRSSLRSRSAPTTSGPRCRSSTGQPGGCRPSRSATSAAGSSAGAPSPPRRRSPRAGGLRPRHAPPRRSRGCCGCRSGRGDWMQAAAGTPHE